MRERERIRRERTTVHAVARVRTSVPRLLTIPPVCGDPFCPLTPGPRRRRRRRRRSGVTSNAIRSLRTRRTRDRTRDRGVESRPESDTPGSGCHLAWDIPPRRASTRLRRAGPVRSLSLAYLEMRESSVDSDTRSARAIHPPFSSCADRTRRRARARRSARSSRHGRVTPCRVDPRATAARNRVNASLSGRPPRFISSDAQGRRETAGLPSLVVDDVVDRCIHE